MSKHGCSWLNDSDVYIDVLAPENFTSCLHSARLRLAECKQRLWKIGDVTPNRNPCTTVIHAYEWDSYSQSSENSSVYYLYAEWMLHCYTYIGWVMQLMRVVLTELGEAHYPLSEIEQSFFSCLFQGRVLHLNGCLFKNNYYLGHYWSISLACVNDEPWLLCCNICMCYLQYVLQLGAGLTFSCHRIRMSQD